MLNEELIDPKDLKILRLKKTIKKFKEYDKERKEYYADAMIRLGEYESLFDEATDCNDIVEKLKKKINNQTKEIRNLRRFIDLNNISSELRNLSFPDLKLSLTNTKAELAKTRNELESLRRTNSNLIYQLVKLKHENTLLYNFAVILYIYIGF